LNHSYEIAPLWVIEHSTFQRKNIGGGSYLIKMILHEFERASKTIEFFRIKLEEIAVKNCDIINSVEDIGKIEKDEELKGIMSSNILELFIGSV